MDAKRFIENKRAQENAQKAKKGKEYPNLYEKKREYLRGNVKREYNELEK